VIIDGYFNQVPAVWHKEILWALAQGIQVFGAASMGALRAAELDEFGMQGVGVIYEAYRNGVYPPYHDQPFEDDDEVAVIHGPKELDYCSACEAMVNIRSSLASASRKKIISRTTRDALVGMAKREFYPNRSFKGLLEQTETTGLPRSEIAALQAWLPTGRIDQKREDALSVLKRLATGQSQQHQELKFAFEHTTLWANAIREMEQIPDNTAPLLNELRLLGQDYFSLKNKILMQAFNTENDQQGQVHKQETAVRSEQNTAWSTPLIKHQELQHFLNSIPLAWIEERMLRSLQEQDQYAALRQRAAEKARKLKQLNNIPPVTELTELQLLQLLDWYFESVLNLTMPDNAEAYAARLGFRCLDDFHQLLLGEYYYQD